MKKTKARSVPASLALLGGCLGGCALAAPVQAADQTPRLYVAAEGGLAVTQPTRVDDSPYGRPGSGDMRYNTGAQGALQFGYNLDRSFSAGLSVGFAENPVESIVVNTLTVERASADLDQIPFLAELTYRPLHGHFRPYLGVGLGATVAVFQGTALPGFTTPTTPRYSAADVTLGFEGKVGLEYNFNPNWLAGVGYELSGSTGHSWRDNSVNFTTGEVLTHCVTVSVTWRF